MFDWQMFVSMLYYLVYYKSFSDSRLCVIRIGT